MGVYVGNRCCFCKKMVFKLPEHSLSRICRADAYPLVSDLFQQDRQALIMVIPCQFGSALDKIAFES